MLYLNEGIQYGYDIQYQYKKRMYTFPANTKIYKVSIFAGGDIAPKFREAHNYVKKCGKKTNGTKLKVFVMLMIICWKYTGWNIKNMEDFVVKLKMF